MLDIAQEFCELFRGNESCRGKYELTPSNEPGKVKGTAYTLLEPATPEIWASHLKGEGPGLGVVPIKDDTYCHWGAIDVDKYSLDLAAIGKFIDKHQLPLVPCRTKSGGVHLFVFLKKPVPAADLISALDHIATIIGFKGSEIFPKQRQILTDQGDKGSWLNMPYYGGDNSTRYGVGPDGSSLTTEEFLEYAKAKQTTVNVLFAFQELELSTDDGWVVNDGPPCLQTLISLGHIGQGMRNNFMFNLAVYLKKKYPDDWIDKLGDANQELCDPPLPEEEITGLVRSSGRKDFEYTCRQEPIKTVCQTGICRTRKHGIGRSEGSAPGVALPVISGISKLDTRPPVWFVDVNGHRLALETEDLMEQKRFQRVCVIELNSMPGKMKENNWVDMINTLLDQAVIIEAPKDLLPDNQLWERIENFCSQRGVGTEKEDIINGMPFSDRETGMTYFRMSAISNYLERTRFKKEVPEITRVLREKGGVDRQITIRGKSVSVWAIPSPEGFDDDTDLPEELNEATKPY